MRIGASALVGLLLLGCGDDGGGLGIDQVIGRVLVSGGNPAAGVTVSVAGFAVSTTTAADGAFRLNGVPVGNLTVVAEGQVGNRLQYVESDPFYFDGRTQVNVGDLTLGTVGQGGLQIGEVSGRAMDLDGNPVVAADVELRGSDGSRTTRTGASGAFVFRSVAPGAYAVIVTATGRQGAGYRGVRDGVVVSTSAAGRLAQNADVIVAPVARLGALQVNVVGAGDTPLPGAQVALSIGPAGGPTVVYAAAANGAGEALFATLPAGEVRITALAPDHANGVATATVVAGTTVATTVRCDDDLNGFQDPPAIRGAVAITYPTGGANPALRAVVAQRHGALPTLSRRPPAGSGIEILVDFTPVQYNDTAGYVLYRGHDDSFRTSFLPVARSNTPAVTRLVDGAAALSTRTRFFYRVSSYGSGGRESHPSGTVSTMPLDPLASGKPADGDTDLPRTGLQFDWDGVARAEAYQVVLFAELPTVAEPVLYASPILDYRAHSHVYAGPELDPAEDYYWYVVAFDTADPVAATAESYSLVKRFVTTAR